MTIGTIQRREKFWMNILYIFLVIWILFSLFSLGWIILTSFKTNKEIYSGVWSLPSKIHIENYQKAWNVVNLKQYFLNSLLVTSSSIVALVFICTPAAYVLSRYKFKYSKFLNNLFIVGMGIPSQLLMIPLYKMFIEIGLADSLFGLALVYVTLSIPLTVFVLSGFIRSLPSQLEDAALIDGCSEIQTFWKIMFPLAQPGIVTASIINFIFLWNEYMLALVFTSSQSKQTLSLGVYAIQSTMQYTADWAGMFAAVVIVMIPTLLLYILLSEKIMSGLTMGAVKG